MKKKFLTFFLFGVGVLIGVSYAPIKKNFFSKKQQKHARIAKKTHPILEQKPFVIVTMSHNNAAYARQNLLSTLTQNYDSFRIIYIDDASTDGTGEIVQSLLKEQGMQERVTYIKNDKQNGAMHNLFQAVHSCSCDEIVVVVDGDDFLAHTEVLSELNAYYANPDVWLTYGNYIEYPTYAKGAEREKGDCRPLNLKIVDSKGVRHHAFVTSHLRTFYAGLFKRVKLQDFLDEGNFFSAACDVASMLPMLELAEAHSYFIPDVLYIYNTANPACDYKINREKQLALEQKIRKKSSYAPLNEYPWHDFVHDEENVDLAVFSYNRPLQLYAFLESAEKNLSHLHRTFVIYRCGSEQYEKAYEEVKQAFPNVIYFKQSEESPFEDFAPLIRRAVFDQDMSTARFVMFAVDDIVVKDAIDLQEAVCHLKQTGAYGFYFRLGKHVDYCYMQDFDQGIPKSIELKPKTFAWQFSSGKGDWRYPNTVDMALYRKDEIYPYFLCMKFHNPNILEALWNEHADLSKVGLYYEETKVVNLPLNIVMENEWVNEKISDVSTKDLLNLFNQGLKMNIEPLHGIDNRSVHIDYEPEFVRR